MIKKIFLLFIFILIKTNISTLDLFFFNNSDKSVEIQILISDWFCDSLIHSIDLEARNDKWEFHKPVCELDLKIRVFIDGIPEDTEYYVKRNEKCKLVIS